MYVSRSKVKKTSIVNQIFHYTVLSCNKVLRGWEFRQLGFEGLGFQPIRFGGARISTNQVSRAGTLANQVFRGWELSYSGAFDLSL
jgi:hypothetical protein